ncbi:MAG TPA: hypothetical protein VMD28_02070 [Acidimicrobiales bacterium]|nr:hypothetical protein [Acidimicrobiales bacterium]
MTGPFLSVTAPLSAASTGSPAGSQSSTVPVALTAGQGSGPTPAGSLVGSDENRPLVTVRAPTQLSTGTSSASQNSVDVPAAVVVGRSSNPDEGGTLVNADAPVDANGSTPTTSQGAGGSSPITVGHGTSVLGGTSGSGSGSFVNVTLPVDAPPAGAGSPSVGTSTSPATIG